MPNTDKVIYKITILVCVTWVICAFVDYFSAKKSFESATRECDFKVNLVKQYCKG